MPKQTIHPTPLSKRVNFMKDCANLDIKIIYACITVTWRISSMENAATIKIQGNWKPIAKRKTAYVTDLIPQIEL